MYSQKIRTFSGCLLKGGTDLTGLSWPTSREYLRLISVFILLSILWDRESPFLQMGNYGDFKWLVRSRTGNLWWGKKRESDRSSKVPLLSSSLYPGTQWGGVGQGTVRTPACVAGLADTAEFPLLQRLSQWWTLLSPCSAARAAHPPTSSLRKASLEREAGADGWRSPGKLSPGTEPGPSLGFPHSQCRKITEDWRGEL